LVNTSNFLKDKTEEKKLTAAAPIEEESSNDNDDIYKDLLGVFN
jgi:hypothetical protein